MATSRPLSTISYNTEDFLRSKLDYWLELHWIQAYQYICHKGEDGDKDHIHLRIEPNKQLDPMNLTLELREYDPKNPDKPLCVRPWRSSKEEDWILYALHDPDYLKLKYGAEYEKGDGKLLYKIEDLHVSQFYDKDVMYIRARQQLENTTAFLIKEIKNGKRALDLVEEGKSAVNTKNVLQLLHMTDYETVCKNYKELYEQYISLQSEYSAVMNLLRLNNISVIFDPDGNISIET